MTSNNFLSLADCCALRGGYLVTINLQHLYESRENSILRRCVFSDAHVHHCLDGRGAHRLFERALGCRLPLASGNEVLDARLRLAAAAQEHVLVIGSKRTTVEKVALRYPGVRLSQDDSYFHVQTMDDAQRYALELSGRFDLHAHHAVALALGVPKQELLAAALSALSPNTPIYCIGGSLEMLAGELRRAPRWMQRIGLEPIWRLALQPERARLIRMLRTYWNFVQFSLHPEKVIALARS